MDKPLLPINFFTICVLIYQLIYYGIMALIWIWIFVWIFSSIYTRIMLDPRVAHSEEELQKKDNEGSIIGIALAVILGIILVIGIA